MTAPPDFDATFHDKFAELVAWRRDVRRFLREPVPREVMRSVFELAQMSPSVGNSQPWRIVNVASAAKREAITRNFRDSNRAALAAQAPSRAADYARLKLEGLDAAPVQLAIFCDRGTAQGHGLGAKSMPETLDYSVVLMISALWLAARAKGLGLGWVSILDPERIIVDLGTPSRYKFIAYLCIGWPEAEDDTPELEREGWQARTALGQYVLHV